MSLARHRTEIETELITEMQLLRPGLVIIGENADTPAANNAPWLRMSITVLEIFRPCIGINSKTRTDALFNVQVFTPLAQGAGEASSIVDEAISVLRNSTLTGIEFLTFDVSTGVVESDWYTLLIRARYRADD
ncbi:MAG: DUF4128 domain-containing protein [Gammaproteobacteria bacterium]|nr:DUF4128 domain-containing protein [Gammaproteobacteria bacterium]